MNRILEESAVKALTNMAETLAKIETRLAKMEAYQRVMLSEAHLKKAERKIATDDPLEETRAV
ncbi:MAG: hypothetical protein O7G83_04345 [Proteobacteria bacterium]|nr:hypothetical protein [Pseudomonadota bacterium]